MRGTFSNPRLENRMSSTQGGMTRHQPSGVEMSIYEAAMRYKADNVPLVIMAGQHYGSGSSRDWAAKGQNLLGVVAVLAQSFERIHRSNLIGMGILPLEFIPEESWHTWGIQGNEEISWDTALQGIPQDGPAALLPIIIANAQGQTNTHTVKIRLDTPGEWDLYRKGGIFSWMLDSLLASS